MISNELYKALVEWLAEAESLDPFWSVKRYGLCSNIEDSDLVEEMKAYWDEEGLSTSFPFNLGDADSYEQETIQRLCHHNPSRLKWVKDKIEEYRQAKAACTTGEN